MNGLLLIREPRVLRIWRNAISDAVEGEVSLTHINPDAVKDVQHLEAILSRRSDFIMLPLTLPYCGSLHLAELIHLERSTTRTVLVTEELGPDQLETIFDAVIPTDRFSSISVKEALGAPILRSMSTKALDDAITRALNAQCFHVVDHVIRSGPTAPYTRPPSLEEYRRSYREKLGDISHRRGNIFSIGHAVFGDHVLFQPQEIAMEKHETYKFGDVAGDVTIKSRLDHVTKTVSVAPMLHADQRQQLSQLIEELRAALQPVESADAHGAERVIQQAEVVLKEVSAEKPNRAFLAVTAEGLKAAAEAVKDIAPSVLAVAGKIATFVAQWP